MLSLLVAELTPGCSVIGTNCIDAGPSILALAFAHIEASGCPNLGAATIYYKHKC